jgi:putative ABC transport system permease protein
MRDIRYAFRSLTRVPGFTAAAVTTLALGSGAVVAVFTLVNAVLLRPLPYRDASHVMLVWAMPPDGSRTWLSVPEVEDLSCDARSLSRIAGLTDLRMNLTDAGAPEELQVVASAALFPMLGIDAALGRTFDGDDDRVGAAAVVLLSDSFWRRRFGADPGIVGRTLRLDGRTYVIRGVLPQAFTLPPPSSVFPASVDVWVPLAPHAQARGRDVRYLHAVARLAPGATPASAEQEAAILARSYSKTYPQAYRPSAWSFVVVPFQQDIARSAKPVLLALGAIVAIVLATSCVNVANLLLTRGESRRRELMVRVALGAGPVRLVRLLFVEALLLATTGCSLGALPAIAIPRLVMRVDPHVLPGLGGPILDARLVGFSILLLLLVTAVCAIVPAAGAARAGDVAAVDRAVGRSSRFAMIGRTLAITQIALAALALVCTALLAHTVFRLAQVPSGIDPHGVLTFRVTLPASYRTGGDSARFFEQATDRLRHLPGVQSVGAITQLPMSGSSLGSSFDVPEPDTTRRFDADLRGVTPDYFSVMRMAMLDGRAFTPADIADHTSVAIVDRTFARRLRADGDVVGMRIRWIRRPDDPIEIVGIVGDVRHRGPAEAARETVYRPFTQYPRGAMTFVVRSAGTPSSLAGPAAAAIQSIDPAQPVAAVASMEQVVGQTFARPRLSAMLASALGLLALMVSVVGVYGVLSYGVSQRVREFAVRLALGARPAQILSLVLREGVLVTLVGLATGFALAPLAARMLAAALFGVGPTDAPAYAAAGALLASAAAFACYLPARRASRSDPMSVLGTE